MCAPSANCADVTFTAISDAYIKADKENNSMTPSIKNLLRAANDINKSGSKFVVFLGNNISSADKYDLVMFAKITKKIEKPVYTGIGNKDIQKTKELDKKEYYRLLNKFSNNKISKLPCAKKLNGFVFIFMDGVGEMVPMPRGYYKDKELIALEKMLDKYKKDNVIIFQHFPLIGIDESSKSVYKKEPYLAILKKHSNVKAIITGQDNKDFEIEDENGIKHINTPGLNAGEYKVINLETKDAGVLVKTKIISVE